MHARPTRILFAPALLAASLAGAPARAQRAAPALTTLDAYRRAARLVDDAVAAHGGLETLRAARHMRVRLEGWEHHRNQSRRVAPPWDSTVRRNDLMVDLARGRLVHTETRGYPGGFHYTRRFVTAGDTSYFLDLRGRSYSVERYPAASTQLGNLQLLPQFWVLAAAELPNAGARRWLGRTRLPSGAVVDALGFPLQGGGFVTIGFDTLTHRLASTMSVGTDVFDGDAEVVTEYLDWRPRDGVLLPTRSVQRRAGDIVSELRYVAVTPGFVLPDSLATPPAGFSRAAPTPPDSTRLLAPGVWAVVASGSTSLLVDLGDHLMVMDASPRGAGEVIGRAAALAPGKPIRFVVPTHHHDDHFGGVRHHAAAGATVVTTPGNLEYARRVLAAPQSTVGPWQGPPVPSARVEAITGRRRVFGSGARTVEIHDIGPSPHADEMLVAWLPAEGILFQADLVDVPLVGEDRGGVNAETTVHLADVVRRRGWAVRTVVGVHGPALDGAAVAAVARQPILPPE